MEEQLHQAAINVIKPSSVMRTTFLEIFACGGELTVMMNDLNMTKGGRIDKALKNAQSFTEAAYGRLR